MDRAVAFSREASRWPANPKRQKADPDSPVLGFARRPRLYHWSQHQLFKPHFVLPVSYLLPNGQELGTKRLTGFCRRSPYSEADAPGNNNSPAGPFGEHKCDPPHRLQESMFKAINKVAPDALFSIFTGDIIEHDIWETTRASNELQSESITVLCFDGRTLTSPRFSKPVV